MKRLIFVCFLPFILSLTTVYYVAINKSVNNLLFPITPSKHMATPPFSFIGSFYENPVYEEQFLNSSDTAETIFLLGSSELTSPSEAIPYNFIPAHFKTRMNAVGHAGNQCFSIYAQLLSNANRLPDAPLVIMLSPGWFESKPAHGTSSSIFLEFNSERFQQKLITDTSNREFQDYLNKRISHMYAEFNSPSLELRLMNAQALSSKSFLHALLFAPVLTIDKFLLHVKKEMAPSPEPVCTRLTRKNIQPESVTIRWDSLFTASRIAVAGKVTNNTMHIADDYYSEHIHGRHGEIEPVAEIFNQEIEDCRMLIRLLRANKSKACFVIAPMNPFYYKNLKDISVTMNQMEQEIRKNDFPCLNLMETDTAKYDKVLLRDIMHFSVYGWYKVDRFIVDTYHLSK